MSKGTVPDWFVQQALGREGDSPLPGNVRDRWGQLVQIQGVAGKDKKQVLATRTYDAPLAWAIQFRFSTDGITFTPEVPLTYGSSVFVDIYKGIDQQSTPSQETIEIIEGNAQPFCNLIAQSLQIVVRADESAPPIWVQAIATIVTNVDCEDIRGPAGGGGGVEPFGPAGTTRWPAVAANTYNIALIPKVRYFVITNQSAANLYVHLGTGVNTTPGSEFATIILPGDAFAGYEVLNYNGPITFKFDADDANGFALTTVGALP